MKTYHMRYNIEPGEFTRDQLDELGGCDAILIASIIRDRGPHDGPVSTAFVHRDGYTGEELVPTELFRTLGLLAHMIMEQDGLPEWQRKLVSDVHETIKKQLTSDR